MTTRKPWGLLCAVAAAVILLSLLPACGPTATPTPQFTLRVGFVRALDPLPFFVMQEQAFTTQNGLRIEEQVYPGGSAMIEALTTGVIDVAYVPNVATFSAAERGLIPGTLVPAAADSFIDPEHPSVGVLAPPSVKSWKDLEGRSIAVVSKTGVSTAAIKQRLQQEGVRDYTLVEIPIANMGLAVAGGNVAAATMVEPFLTQSLLRGDGNLLGWVIGGFPIERMESILIVFRADVYRNDPQAAKAFLGAHLQAVKWISENEQAARSILAKRLEVSEEVGQKMNLVRWPLDARNDPVLLESVQPLLVEIGTLKAPIPASQLYDETLLEEVLAETH